MTIVARDILCIDSLRTGRFARAGKLLAQRIYHRLITPRGMLRGGEDEANFGYDLAAHVGGIVSVPTRVSVEQSVVNEILKERQVESVTCSISETRTAGGDVSWAATVEVQSAAGPFDLVRAVGDVTINLVGLAA
jgi:hypothetical protein